MSSKEGTEKYSPKMPVLWIAVFRFCSSSSESLRYLGIGGLVESEAIPEISATKMSIFTLNEYMSSQIALRSLRRQGDLGNACASLQQIAHIFSLAERK